MVLRGSAGTIVVLGGKIGMTAPAMTAALSRDLKSANSFEKSSVCFLQLAGSTYQGVLRGLHQIKIPCEASFLTMLLRSGYRVGNIARVDRVT